MKSDQIANKICSLDYQSNDNNVLEYVFWQTTKIKEIFQNYYNVICVDATFNLNRSLYSLYIVITIDAANDTRVVALGLIANDRRTDIMTSFFKWFNNENPNYTRISTILTDKNETQINVLRDIYPNANISLCLFHILKALKLESKKKLHLNTDTLNAIRGI